ncbi:MAG: hypothetical protein PHP02_03115 [Eubacteriales bacterium]|nr:hypothetical protein [Eubacteriales bacterium]
MYKVLESMQRNDAEQHFRVDNAAALSTPAEARFHPYFAPMQVKLRPAGADTYTYTCQLPVPSSIAANMAEDRFYHSFRKTHRDLKVSGTLHVVRDKGGKWLIQADPADPVISTYLLLNGIRLENMGMASEAFDYPDMNARIEAWAQFYVLAMAQYQSIVDISEDVQKELADLLGEQFQARLLTTTSSSKELGVPGPLHDLRILPAISVWWLAAYIGLILLVILILILTVRNLIYGWVPLDERWQNHADRLEKKMAKFSYSQEKNQRIHREFVESLKQGAGAPGTKPRHRLRENVLQWRLGATYAWIYLSVFPDGKQMTFRRLFHSFMTYNLEDRRADTITDAGWMLCACVRNMLAHMTPARLKAGMLRMDKALQAYEAAKELVDKLEQEIPEGFSSESAKKAKAHRAARDRFLRKFGHNQLLYAVSRGGVPVSLMLNIAGNPQQQFDRFLQQGVIMGFIPYIVKYQGNPDAKQVSDAVLAARRSLISTDNRMAFFQVRGYSNELFTGRDGQVDDIVQAHDLRIEDYSIILREVLWCANPSVKLSYEDLHRLVKRASEAIPGVMGLLTEYPMRIIDPANQSALGFYQFEPYIHSMWTRYEPPLHQGRVLERYHEVMDMTLPNSTGFHLRLFADTFVLIPVLFHEYSHYRGDHNEASVFLRTHFFSQDFYRKHPEANPVLDAVFSRLQQLLGAKPDPKKVDDLNGLIEMYYGRQVPQKEAEEQAETTITRINAQVELINRTQSWCPDVKMPRLDKEEDHDNEVLIRDIIIRFATTPRAITEEDFKKIEKKWDDYSGCAELRDEEEETGIDSEEVLRRIIARLNQ